MQRINRPLARGLRRQAAGPLVFYDEVCQNLRKIRQYRRPDSRHVLVTQQYFCYVHTDVLFERIMDACKTCLYECARIRMVYGPLKSIQEIPLLIGKLCNGVRRLA